MPKNASIKFFDFFDLFLFIRERGWEVHSLRSMGIDEQYDITIHLDIYKVNKSIAPQYLQFLQMSLFQKRSNNSY